MYFSYDCQNLSTELDILKQGCLILLPEVQHPVDLICIQLQHTCFED